MPDLPKMRLNSKSVLVLSLAIAGLSVCDAAVGQNFCSEPVEPYCVGANSQFDTLLQVNRCEDDLTDYEQQVNDYEQCITNQIEGLRQELSAARKKIEEARKNF